MKRGRWQIERERCQIEREEPAPPYEEAYPVKAAVAAIVQRLGLGGQHWQAALAKEWPAIVGEPVAAHTRPGLVESGRLTVYVDSSVWLSELARCGVDMLLARVRSRFAEAGINAIALRLDPEPPGIGPARRASTS